MPHYSYKALNNSGKNVKGSIEADSSHSARKKLRDSGLFVTRLDEIIPRTRTRAPFLTMLTPHREKTAFLASLSRQLATLMTAGLPLVRAFDAIIEQMDSSDTRTMINAIKDSIKEGESLASALKRFPDFFPDLMTNMIEAGESSGALDLTLGRLADYYETRIRLRNRIRATMAYPVFMSVVGLGVLIFLFIFLIPRVTAIFDQMETTLPLPTRMLISLSNGVQNYWFVFPLLVIALLIAVGYIKNNQRMMETLDRKKLELPLIGPLLMKLAVSRFARTLGTLLSGGISLFQALGIVRTIMNNRFLATTIDDIRIKIGEGGSLTAFLREKRIFPSIFLHMTGVGEETGELEQMMERVADTFESDVDQTISTVTSLLEPIMILAMGLVVGTIVIAILLPIFEMSQVIR